MVYSQQILAFALARLSCRIWKLTNAWYVALRIDIIRSFSELLKRPSGREEASLLFALVPISHLSVSLCNDRCFDVSLSIPTSRKVHPTIRGKIFHSLVCKCKVRVVWLRGIVVASLATTVGSSPCGFGPVEVRRQSTSSSRESRSFPKNIGIRWGEPRTRPSAAWKLTSSFTGSIACVSSRSAKSVSKPRLPS